MILIEKKDLLIMLQRTAPIKQHKILPILNYFKLQCIGDRAIFTDTNMGVYCIHEMPASFKKEVTLLLDKSVLMGFVKQSKGSLITITYDKKKFYLDDQKQKGSGQLGDSDNYPAVPERGSDKKTELPQEVLDAIAIASGYTASDGGNITGIDFWESVHLKATKQGTEIIATDRHKFYFNQFAGIFVNIILLPDHCKLLQGFTRATHYQCGNYDFFDCGFTTYGVIRSEHKTPDYSAILGLYKPLPTMTIKKEDLLEFCDLVTAINPSMIFWECIITDGGASNIFLNFSNKEYDVQADRSITVIKDFILQKIVIGIKTLQATLKPLPFTELKIAQPDNTKFLFYADEEPSYKGAIMALQQ